MTGICLEKSEVNKLTENQSSFLRGRVVDALEHIKKQEQQHSNVNSRTYRTFHALIKSQLLVDRKELVTNKLILQIFTEIFDCSLNFPMHVDTVRLLIDYLSDENVTHIVISDLIEDFVRLSNAVVKPYVDIDEEKFKFTDLLKDEKEQHQKRAKAPRAIKSEIREKILLFMKSLLSNKRQDLAELITDNIKAETGIKFLDSLLSFFDAEKIKAFVHEQEKNRKIFVELYYQFLVKYFTLNKSLKLSSNLSTDEKLYKMLLQNIEIYFSEEIFDSNTEIRQMSVTLMNLAVSSIPKSDFFEPMARMFVDSSGESQLQMQLLQSLRYLEDDTKKVEIYFNNYKEIFSNILNLYIDEKPSFGTLCESFLKISLEKFPIFCINELMKAKNKNQMNRIEILDRIYTKAFKAASK